MTWQTVKDRLGSTYPTTLECAGRIWVATHYRKRVVAVTVFVVDDNGVSYEDTSGVIAQQVDSTGLVGSKVTVTFATPRVGTLVLV